MMLRRSALALSRRRLSIQRVYGQCLTPQVYPSSRRDFSSVSAQNAAPRSGSSSKPNEPGNNLTKIVGGVAVGVCFYAAYSRGYLNDILGKNEQHYDPLKADDSNSESVKDDQGLHGFQNNKEPALVHTSEDFATLNSLVKDAEERTEKESAIDLVGDSGEEENGSFARDSSSETTESFTCVKEEDLGKISDGLLAKNEDLSKSSSEKMAKDENPSAKKLSQDSEDMKLSGGKVHLERHEADENLSMITDVGSIVQGNNLKNDETPRSKLQNEPKDMHVSGEESSGSLLETYVLKDKVDEHINNLESREKFPPSPTKDLGDAYVSKEGKLILDFLQAIHTAEQRQAELDARVFAEEKRAMKEKYEKDLKDARARELMYAEEAAMLEKEVQKERSKAAAALKSLQERAEERLKNELEEKEKEAERKLTESQEIAKAELAASLAREKAAQLEKMAEANVNINALCMAFYARSEEARQTHSIHKLALGALALEDALSNGQPVQSEIDTLQVYVDNVDKDSLLQLALSSIPEDVRLHGSDTPLQLNQKFDSLKGKLRHFSLIPPNGGGILAHSLAHVASYLKVKETDQSGDGIESVLNKVENLLAQGKLVEAADVLEDGVKGSKAAEVVGEWLTRARNRAIAEQALVLLQSYAASVSLT